MIAYQDGLSLTLYRCATALFGAVAARAYLRGRLRRGKEDAARLSERLGHAGRPRPDGRLLWLHGASVGEGLALLPLIERLVGRGFGVLVTTGTVTSARVLAQRLPAGAIHQFVVLDVAVAVRRFLRHWQPDLCLLAESELWPNLIVETSRRGIPLALVNARLSARSFARWRRMRGLIRPLLGRVALCLAQSATDAARLTDLGAVNVSVAGNLKMDAVAPPADAAELAGLRPALGWRALWLAASTHATEEDAILAAHRRVALAHPDLLTIIAPRQAERGAAIAERAAALGLSATLRSTAQRIAPETAVYIADTMGELGLFYRLARVVFVGKSLGGGGGQNPIEPAKLGCAILHGPQVANFAEIYGELDEGGGARPVSDADALGDALLELFAQPAARDRLASAAAAVVAARGGVADRILHALEPLLPTLAATSPVR